MQDSASMIQTFPDLQPLWNMNDPIATETALAQLLPRARELQGPARSHLPNLLLELARVQNIQKKSPEARIQLDEVERLLKEEPNLYTVPLRLRWLLERGRLYIASKTPSQAHTALIEAWTLAVNSGEDDLGIQSAQILAAIEPPKSQQEWIRRAIQIAEASPQTAPKLRLGNLYASLGWKLFDLRQYENALETFQKSLSHLKIHGTQREIFIARWSAGKVLRAMDKPEDALVIQNALLAELGASGEHDGRLYEELAECLQTLRRSNEAQLYFELAYHELSNDQWVTDNQPVKLKRLKDLGKVKEKR